MTAPDGAQLDAGEFDLDGWIDGLKRPEVTVELYPFEAVYKRKVAAIEAQIPAAEKVGPEDRGLDDASAEQLRAQLAELAAERSRTALRVRIRQLLDDEITAAVQEAQAGIERVAPVLDSEGNEIRYVEDVDPEDYYLWSLAAACVEPNFTGERLRRLRDRDRSGREMVAQLLTVENELLKALPVPS